MIEHLVKGTLLVLSGVECFYSRDIKGAVDKGSGCCSFCVFRCEVGICEELGGGLDRERRIV